MHNRRRFIQSKNHNHQSSFEEKVDETTMPPNVVAVEHHHHRPPVSDPATSAVTMTKSRVFVKKNPFSASIMSNNEKENYNVNNRNNPSDGLRQSQKVDLTPSSPAAKAETNNNTTKATATATTTAIATATRTSTTTKKKRFQKFKTSLKEIRNKVQQSRHCDSKMKSKQHEDNHQQQQEEQQFSHTSEITLFHSTSTFDNLPSVSSSMSSSAPTGGCGAGGGGGGGGGGEIAYPHRDTTFSTLSNAKNDNNNSTHSLQVKSKGCHNLDCILPPPPSSLITQRSFRHPNSYPFHQQQNLNIHKNSLEKKWFTLRDDPTVEESIECVFSHQLEDGSAILGLEVMDDGMDNMNCTNANHTTSANSSGGSSNSGSSNSTDGIDSFPWNDDENEFTSGKIEYVGVVNNHDVYQTNTTTNDDDNNNIMDNKHNRNNKNNKNNKNFRPKMMKFRKPTKRYTKSDPGIIHNRKTRNQKQLENNSNDGDIDHNHNQQQQQHLNEESRLTKSLPPTMKLESNSPTSTSSAGLSEQPAEDTNTIIQTKTKSSTEQKRKEMSPILPKSNQWPQCPLLLRPSPRSGTHIRSVRYANELNGKNLMDANLNTMWWEQISSQDKSSEQQYNQQLHQKHNTFCRDSCILPINNGNEKEGQTLVIDFESNLFVGTLQLRIRRSNGTTKKPYDDSFGFFKGRNRQYQCLISGRFKKEGIPMTECITGQMFDKPLKPPAPYITKGAIKLITFFAPMLQANLTGRYPMAISPLGSTPQSIQVDDLTVGTNNNDEGFKACGTLLGSQEEPSSSSRRLIPLPTKATKSSSSSMSRAKARKKAFDKLCGAEDKSLTFRTDKIYTFEFLQHLVNFDTLEMNLGSMLGKYKLNNMMNGQPLKIMAAQQSSNCDDEKASFDILWSFDLWHESILRKC